jgi:hypothetical protein
MHCCINSILHVALQILGLIEPDLRLEEMRYCQLAVRYSLRAQINGSAVTMAGALDFIGGQAADIRKRAAKKPLFLTFNGA